MKINKIMSILIILATIFLLMGSAYALGKTTDLKKDHANQIEVKDDKLIDMSNKKEIGTIKPIENPDEAEKTIKEYDSNPIKKTVSDNPQVIEYNVEDKKDSSHSGIYWVFKDKNGDYFQAFCPAESMQGDKILSRMTEFCNTNSIL